MSLQAFVEKWAADNPADLIEDFRAASNWLRIYCRFCVNGCIIHTQHGRLYHLDLDKGLVPCEAFRAEELKRHED